MAKRGAPQTGDTGGAGSRSWDRFPGESAPAYLAFVAYRDLGPSRSIEEAWRATWAQGSHRGRDGGTRAPGRFREWARRWRWAERAAAWDAHLQRSADAAREAAVADDAAASAREALLERRRRDQEETEWDLRCRLVEEAEKMLRDLRRPVTSRKPVMHNGARVRENGQPLEIVTRRYRWNGSTLARMIRLATDLGRLSTKMPPRVDQGAPPPMAELLSKLFTTDGQLEAALPPGVVQPMPVDVNAVPSINVGSTADGGSPLRQPPMERPEP